MKFEGGSFEPIKNFPKNFFTGSFSGSGPEMHRFVWTLEQVWVWATYSCYELSLFISGSPRKRALDFKIQKKTQLLHSKKKTQLLIIGFKLVRKFYSYNTNHRWESSQFLFSSSSFPSLILFVHSYRSVWTKIMKIIP